MLENYLTTCRVNVNKKYIGLKMNNRNMAMKSQQPQQQDPIEMVKKYTNLLWRKKLWIILITVIISIVWFFISPMVMKPPEYNASVIIKFDDPRRSANIGGIRDFVREGNSGKIAMLNTHSVLSKVVDSLTLNVRINSKEISYFSFFNKIIIKEDPKYGSYEFIANKSKSQLNLYYTNERENIHNRLVSSQDYKNDSIIHVDIDGLTLFLNPNSFYDLNKVNFSYVATRFVVERLKLNINKNIDESHTVFTISYSDKDPNMAAAVINTLSYFYIEELLHHKKYRTSSILYSLEEQLKGIKRELEISETRLRQFRERNPFLMLTREGANIVTQLSDQQSELSAIELSLERINYLIQNKNNLTGENRNSAYLEILSTISSRNIAGSQVILDQYSTLANERIRLRNENYSEDHMLVQEVSLRLKTMHNEIDTRVNQFLGQLQDQRNNLQQTVKSNENNIQRLPRNELRLAELERDRQVKSNIYSNILVRYNEAKVSDASVIPDAFIIEKAQIPIVIPSIIDKLLKLLMGPLLGLFLAIGLFLMLDFLDKSVQGADEVEAKVNLPVLATIPIILKDNAVPEEIENHRQLEPKLITSNYAPSIANEKFRLLRTKLLMQVNQKRSYIITSLTAGDGKSLMTANIAITFAQQKLSTLLLDCDLRRGVLHNSFKCNKKPGLTDILGRNTPITQNDISSVTQSTHIPNLFLFPSGTQVPNPSELMGSNRMQQLLELLQKKFSTIIMDTPPIEFIADAFVLNSLVHNMLFVVRYGKTNLNKVSDKIAEYSNVKEDFKGVIINASPEAEKEKYQSYSYYHY